MTSQMFGVPPQQAAPTAGFGPSQSGGFGVFPSTQQGGASPFFGGVPQYSPLGNLAAYKGDLIYPVITIGFFVLGVIVVVKVLLSLLALMGAKLFHGFMPRSLDELLDRKRRSTDEPVDQDKIDGLTSVIMAALDSQQCQQRMMCELGAFVQKYDSAHLIAGIAERFVPDDYVTQIRAFKSGANCDDFQCGRSAQLPSTSSKDVESL